MDHTSHLLAQPASCLRPSARAAPLFEIFAEELRYLMGDKGYNQIKNKT